jgi:hypothetical protein
LRPLRCCPPCPRRWRPCLRPVPTLGWARRHGGGRGRRLLGGLGGGRRRQRPSRGPRPHRRRRLGGPLVCAPGWPRAIGGVRSAGYGLGVAACCACVRLVVDLAFCGGSLLAVWTLWWCSGRPPLGCLWRAEQDASGTGALLRCRSLSLPVFGRWCGGGCLGRVLGGAGEIRCSFAG